MAGMAMPGMQQDSSKHWMMMPGMLTDDEMAALPTATGPAFDRLPLQGMIRHHQGALTMVSTTRPHPGRPRRRNIPGPRSVALGYLSRKYCGGIFKSARLG